MTSAQVHVTILPDNDQVILCFIGDAFLDGFDVAIYRLSDAAKGEADGAISCKIRGNDARFVFSALGLTIEDERIEEEFYL